MCKPSFNNELVGVIGTKATINSKVYQNKLEKHCIVRSLSTPLLAPMIEEGFINNKISSTVIEEYLNNPILKGVKALLLGCTHYPMIHNEIDRIYKGAVTVLDSNTWIALELQKQLTATDKLSLAQENPDEFYVSDKTDSFERSTRFFFGQSVELKEVKTVLINSRNNFFYHLRSSHGIVMQRRNSCSFQFLRLLNTPLLSKSCNSSVILALFKLTG